MTRLKDYFWEVLNKKALTFGGQMYILPSDYSCVRLFAQPNHILLYSTLETLAMIAATYLPHFKVPTGRGSLVKFSDAPRKEDEVKGDRFEIIGPLDVLCMALAVLRPFYVMNILPKSPWIHNREQIQ